MSDDESTQLHGGPRSDDEMTGPHNPDDILPGEIDLTIDPDETADDDDELEDES